METDIADEDGTITWNGTQDIPHMNMRDVQYGIIKIRVICGSMQFLADQ